MRNITVTRTIGPWGCGLAGYLDGRLVVVLPVETKRASRWLLAGVTSCDRRRVTAMIEVECSPVIPPCTGNGQNHASCS